MYVHLATRVTRVFLTFSTGLMRQSNLMIDFS